MRCFALATLSAAALAIAAPAFAQTAEELVVTGRALGARPQSLSQTVSYADLDLTQARDRRVLLQRVNYTAGWLCDRLNEARPAAGNLGHSCQEVAVRDAMVQARLAYAGAGSNPAYAQAPAYVGEHAYATSATVAENGPIPDTPANRARYGGPVSRAGRHTAANGR